MREPYKTNAILINQGTYSFYVFKMPSSLLREISYVSRRTLRNREGIQRQLSKVRLTNIGRYIKTNAAVFEMR